MTSGLGSGTSGVAQGTGGGASPVAIDRAADRSTFVLYGVMMIAAFVVAVLSAVTEAGRGSAVDPARLALWDGTSILVILALMPLVARVTTWGTPGVQPWPRVLAVHGAGVLAFSLVHIMGMVMLRKLASPIVFDFAYTFTDNLPREFVYELRKDAISYAILVIFLVLGRELAQIRAELDVARAAAAPRTLTYRSGGATVVLSAADVLWAKSEGNYAEVHSTRQKHFVRTTLKALQDDLVEAGVPAVRVHRSFLVVPAAAQELSPTGSGDHTLVMADGAEVPVSRRYRNDLPIG